MEIVVGAGMRLGGDLGPACWIGGILLTLTQCQELKVSEQLLIWFGSSGGEIKA